MATADDMKTDVESGDTSYGMDYDQIRKTAECCDNDPQAKPTRCIILFPRNVAPRLRIKANENKISDLGCV